MRINNRSVMPRRDVRDFDDIEQDLNTVKCQLTCACFALGHAQDANDDVLGSKAWKVIDACVEGLNRLEGDLDQWQAHHKLTVQGPSND